MQFAIMSSPVLLWTYAIICLLQTTLSIPTANSPAFDNLKELSSSFEFDNVGVVSRFQRGDKQEENLLFEESVDDYPSDVIQDLLSKSPALKLFFKRVKVPDFRNRQPSFDQAEDKGLCETTFGTYWPRKLKNRKGKEMFIVNQDKAYQPIHSEVCSKDVTCTFKEFFPSNYQSECKQKYSVARLMAMNSPTDTNLMVSEFDIPCGCVCTIKRM